MRIIKGFRWTKTLTYPDDLGYPGDAGHPYGGYLFGPEAEFGVIDPDDSVTLQRVDGGNGLTALSLVRGETVLFRLTVLTGEIEPDEVVLILGRSA